MKEVLVISGKGGTGKTSITAAVAELFDNILLADCDVDAPDLHMLLKPRIIETDIFMGGKFPIIDRDLCIKCGTCREVCGFGAISEDIVVDPLACEGCAVCSWNCPQEAITMIQKEAGRRYYSEVGPGHMVHALLKPGEENSGKLVAEVKKKANAIGEEKSYKLLITDGPPGIGCPVIASLSGVDLAVVVTEPTKSGIHDMERVLATAKHFKTPVKVVINKADLNEENTQALREGLAEKDIEVMAEVPYSRKFTEALREAKTIVEYAPESEESRAVRKIAEAIGEFAGIGLKEKG
ncbi:MAG: P-loop NTPase [Elusimicrobia bacterium]|nr:P-loop NTPase [Elusimicrobiota bacterium]